MWIFPGGGFNIIESGFANMDPLFVVAPWEFLFLIPAVTMKMFAEEHRSGTIEILLTQPISDLQIVLAKFFSAVILVVFALLPTINCSSAFSYKYLAPVSSTFFILNKLCLTLNLGSIPAT